MILCNFVILLLSVWCAKADYSSLHWSICNKHPSVTLTAMDVTPMPMILPGIIHLTTQGSFGRPLGAIQMHVSVKRETFLIDIPIPCLMHLGSCTYEISCSGTSLLDTIIKENWAGIMGDIAAQFKTMIHSLPGLNFTVCPVRPGTINFQQFPIILPTLPSFLSF